jgi:hypothetical protein
VAFFEELHDPTDEPTIKKNPNQQKIFIAAHFL